jgi:hypothetical protein
MSRDVLLTIDTHSNPKINEWCQRHLFSLGFCWRSDEIGIVRYLTARYLTVHTNNKISYMHSTCEVNQKADEYEHIDTHDYFNNNVIKELPECD